MIGQKIIHIEKLDSTNNYIANLVKSGTLTNGTVIMADEQTAGKGQRGSSWTSEPYNNLIFSCYITHSDLLISNQNALNYFVSLALISLLKEKGIHAQIKWPNDILVGTLKIGGVLIENQIHYDKIKSSIIGIGLNVNQKHFSGLKASSILNETGKETNRTVLGLELIEKLNVYLNLLRIGKFEILKKEYMELLWGSKELLDYQDKFTSFKAQILDVDSTGKLHLKLQNGEQRIYDLKEIQFKDRL